MSQYENEQAAAEALAAAAQADATSAANEPNINRPAPEQAQAAPGSDTEGTTFEDSFTGLDPNTLPDEARPYYDSMLADYRRKTQAVAEERRAFETLNEFGGVEAAREAVEFVSNLASDPNYALQVHEQLTNALTQAGLTPRQASAEASRQINEAVVDNSAQSQSSQDNDDDIGFGVDPAVDRRISELESSLQEERSWRENQEEIQLQRAMVAEMERMHATVQSKHPDYTEDDLSAVYSLAYSTGGDLLAADELFQALRQNVVSSYIQQKSTVPSGVGPIDSSGYAERPEKFTDLNDPRLEKLVQERLAQELVNNG